MIDAFTEGANIAAHHVEVIDICKKNIRGCLACEYCHTKDNGVCVQKDDMQEVYGLPSKTETLKKGRYDFKFRRRKDVRQRIVKMIDNPA